MRTDYRLLAAVVAPLLLVWWVPPWDSPIPGGGLPDAIVFCLSVAVLEEIIFRGGIQVWLLRKSNFRSSLWGLSHANWATSSIFAVAHIWQHSWWLVPGYLAVSLVLGYFRERYNGIRVPVALHGYYNLALLLLPRIFS